MGCPVVPKIVLAAVLLAQGARTHWALAQVGSVQRLLKLSDTTGGEVPPLRDGDQLGRAVARLGDLDGDGVVDIAAAGHGDDTGGRDQGSVYMLFLDPTGRVRARQKISELTGGFQGVLDPGDQFGRAIAGIGDLDGDGVTELAVGANYDDDGGYNRGAVWILYLERGGRVRQTSKISSLQGGFVGPLANGCEFGRAVAAVGDLDGDGLAELAVGAPTDNTGGTRRGAVWILFLRSDGSVRAQVKIASGRGGFQGRLHNTDWFGFSLASLGDFDRDGISDLCVGAALDDDGAVNAGAVWLLYMNADGTVKGHSKISMLSGGFTGALESPDQFGTSVMPLPDLDDDGVIELAVGATKDGDGGLERGAVYVLFLDSSGSVRAHQKISSTEGNFTFPLSNGDWLGSSLCALSEGDLDTDIDLIIGARFDDDGGANRGALYLAGLAAGELPLLTDLRPAALPEVGSLAAGETLQVLTAGPEPREDLAFLPGESGPGRCVLELAGAPAGARIGLLVGRERLGSALAGALPSGLLIAPAGLLPGLQGEVLPGGGAGSVRIALDLPAGLAEQTLLVQAVWSLPGATQPSCSDALEFFPGSP
jgi:hypothetical protein